jgi:hypothetical protein
MKAVVLFCGGLEEIPGDPAPVCAYEGYAECSFAGWLAALREVYALDPE